MENNNSKAPAIIAAVIGIAVVIGGVMWFTNSNKDDTKNESASSQQESTQSDDSMTKSVTIVKVASDTEALSTLVTAVKAAGLVETLQGEGPFTVFAPTNAAFEALPEGTVANLLKPENKDQLAAVLTYHVVSGKVLSSDLSDGQVIDTVQGGKLKVSIEDGKVYIVDAKGGKALVEKADVDAGNGVVHVINSVLLPS